MMVPDYRDHQYVMRLSNVGISFKRGLKRGLNESPQKRGTPCIKAFPCIRPCSFGRDEAPTCIETKIYHFCYTFT